MEAYLSFKFIPLLVAPEGMAVYPLVSYVEILLPDGITLRGGAFGR